MMDFVLGIFATVAAFVGGQFTLKLVIEPAQEMKRTIGLISYSLIEYSKDISNPRSIDKDKAHKIYTHLNALAAQLQGSFYLIPKWIRNRGFCAALNFKFFTKYAGYHSDRTDARC